MAEEQSQSGAVEVEVKDRGLFDFLGKKEEEKVEEKKCEKGEEEVLVAEMERVRVEETKEEDKKVDEAEKKEEKHGLLEKLQRSHSSSSSSSSDEEEIGEDGEKRRKKKGLKEKIKEKLHGDGEEKKPAEAEEVFVQASTVTVDDTSVEVERLDESVKLEEAPAEEKKGFLEKIKEKLPGHGQPKKSVAEEVVAAPECAAEQGKEHEGEGQKKGFLEKIKEKLPGYHKNGGEDCGPTTATN